MNIKFELKGYYERNDEVISLSLISQPTIKQLVDYLNNLIDHNGVLNLRNDQEENHKPYKLTLYSDDHNYLLMMATILPDGEMDVRTLYNPLAPDEFMPILGEAYGAETVVQDFELVIKAFTEYLETGDVSRELLD